MSRCFYPNLYISGCTVLHREPKSSSRRGSLTNLRRSVSLFSSSEPSLREQVLERQKRLEQNKKLYPNNEMLSDVATQDNNGNGGSNKATSYAGSSSRTSRSSRSSNNRDLEEGDNNPNNPNNPRENHGRKQSMVFNWKGRKAARKARKLMKLREAYRVESGLVAQRRMRQIERADSKTIKIHPPPPGHPLCSSYARYEPMQRQTSTLKRWKDCHVVLSLDQFLYCFEEKVNIEDTTAPLPSLLFSLDTRLCTASKTMGSQGEFILTTGKTKNKGFGLKSTTTYTFRASSYRTAEKWVVCINDPLANVPEKRLEAFQKQNESL